ncbi:hypothetical protein OsJ_21203 [Oryza sativa Japonica Group]|uniref:Uncharacterized protein n=1 Tax=Oryza sativa subsp. japonica TaxID=39947 RepID=B9FT23_ORYSJ|nr:hypothetical protein OsJ_21203 [Oryza sativa Japonica Group]
MVAAGEAGQHHESGGAEWRVTVAEAPEAEVEHENAKGARRGCCCAPAAAAWVLWWLAAPWKWVARFGRTAWKVGADDPRRVVHGFKTAMWAVLTVVVVFEYTVGGCMYKGLNRAMATVAGGALALGVHWVADKSGDDAEPFVLTASLFVLAAAASFSRFIPTLKARFDYGVTIFILTYSLVAVSGYRVDTLVTMAQQRLITIAIGAFICFAVCTLVFPVWAGQELHVLVARNMDKLAAAIEACVDDYFSSAEHAGGCGDAATALSEKARGYRAVLNAKASEDSLANLARWEPGHGKFGFRHPYGQYQNVGAAMRCCAYCIDALAACVGAGGQAPAHVKRHLAGACVALSQHCAAVLREASGSVTSMTRSGRLALVVGDMNAAAQDLRNELRCLAEILDDDEEEEAASSEAEQHEHNTAPPPPPPLIEALPLFTAASLLLEISTRAEGVVAAVDALGTTAKFKKADHAEPPATTTLDAEAAMPVPNSNAIAADEAHGNATAGEHDKKETAEQTTTTSASTVGQQQEARDQVGQLVKLLMRRRSTKKWARGEPKVGPCPRPPLDFPPVHAPSPRSRSTELAGHPPVVPSPRHRSMDLASHGLALPSSRHRSMDLASHGPVLPSPRNRSMDFTAHAPSPRNRSILGMA